MAFLKAAVAEHDTFDYDACDGRSGSNRIHLISFHQVKGAEGIVRVFFCTLVGKRIVMLHSFIKKSDKTPPRERGIAEARMKEVKHAHA